MAIAIHMVLFLIGAGHLMEASSTENEVCAGASDSSCVPAGKPTDVDETYFLQVDVKHEVEPPEHLNSGGAAGSFGDSPLPEPVGTVTAPTDDTTEAENHKMSALSVQIARSETEVIEQLVATHMRFTNQSAKDAFTTQHREKLLGLAAFTDREGRVAKKQQRGSTCPLKRSGQYFSPRLNLCGSSFTGLSSCSEYGCAVLAGFFYQGTCRYVYYTNADPDDSDSYGMCRCWREDDPSINVFRSSSGNSIYSCSSDFQ